MIKTQLGDVWLTDEYTHCYGDLLLSGVVNSKGRLEISTQFDRFEFLETDDLPDEPWDYPSMPDAIQATSESGERIDIPVTAPIAKILLKRGLVSGVPDYIIQWLESEP